MRPQAGVDRLKPVPPMRANDLPLVAQAVSPASCIFSQLLTVGPPIRATTVILLCHKLHAQATTYWTARKLLDKGSGNLDAEGGDGIRVMPLGSHPSPPAAGTGE